MTTRPSIALMLTAATLAGCATAPPTMEVWQPAPVGTSWSTQQRNTGSFGKDAEMRVTRLPDMAWQGAPAVALKVPSGTLLQNPADGRWLAVLGAEGKPMLTWDPPAGWPLPLVVGSSWKGPRKMTSVPTGKTFEYEGGCTVPGVEKVSVPAGSFEAFRVECTSSNDAQDTYWVAPGVHPFVQTRLVRGPKHPQGPGTQEAQLLKLPS